MKGFHGYLREVRSIIAKGHEGCEMGKTQSESQEQAAKRSDPLALDEWLADLNELTSAFRRARESAARHRGEARHSTKEAEAWDKVAANQLEEIITMMRGRCGDDFVTALTALGREIRQDEDLAQDLAEVDEDTRFGLPDDNMQVNPKERSE